MNDVLTYQIINALQIHPRVSWARLGRLLNVDPSTISRRWNALVGEGLVWTSCFEAAGPPGTYVSEISAIVEIRCRPGERAKVVGTVSRLEQVFSVNFTSGERDLYLMITTRTLAEMDAYVDERIARVDGVLGVQVHYLRNVFFESSYWRLPYLTPEQAAALARLRPERMSVRPKPDQQAVIAALGEDMRRTAADVRAEVGRSLASVTRTIDSLLASDHVRWTVDFAQSLMGWQAGAVLWMDVPQSALEQVAASLRTIPNARMCASVSGPSNLALTLWLHDLQEFDEIERTISSRFPRVTVRDRWVVPRAAKRAGFLLDEDGKRTGRVPVHGKLVFES